MKLEAAKITYPRALVGANRQEQPSIARINRADIDLGQPDEAVVEDVAEDLKTRLFGGGTGIAGLATRRVDQLIRQGFEDGRMEAILGRTENSGAIRAAAATALARALRGTAPKGETYKALLGAMGDSDVAVRTASGAALGSAKLTDAQREEVLAQQRVN